MGRPIKQGLDYFPLDTDFFTNKKIKSLRRAHGSTGVLTYLNLLCRVYRNGYYYKFDDLEELSMDIAEEIACTQIRATATGVTETINYLVGRGILNQGLFERGIISGVALQEQYAESAYKAKRNIKMDAFLLTDVLPSAEKNGVSSEEMGVSSEESAQSKVKVKVKEKTTTTEYPILSTIARVREGVPESLEVREYFDERMPGDIAGEEAYRFIKYNEEREWRGVTDWTVAADRWISRLKGRN